jgi:hypothetical protein
MTGSLRALVTIEVIAVPLALLLWVGCSANASYSNPLVVEGMSSDITAACDVAHQRCSRCHTVERLLRARVTSPRHWRNYIEKMRLKPSSGISTTDASMIKRCLVFRSFGRADTTQDEGRAPTP